MPVSLYSPNQQTKQQLEELDELLQRMLALPMSGGEPIPSAAKSPPANPEVFAPSPPTLPPPTRSMTNGDPVVHAWRVQAPVPTDGSTFTQSMPQPPMATPASVPEEQMPPEPRFFVSPVSASPPSGNAPSAFPYAMVFGPQTAPTMPPVNPMPGTGIPGPQWEIPKAKAAAPPLPVALWPVYLLNKLFDLLTLPLGPLGSWLRQPGGRNALGWLGILMILGAIGWGVADWYGLEWTR